MKKNQRLYRDNAKDYLDWSGITGYMSNSIDINDISSPLFNMLLSLMFRGLTEDSSGVYRKIKSRIKSFIDPKSSFFFESSETARRFIEQISGINKYDLLIHELRSEQQKTSSNLLSSEGKYMPSVLKALSAGEDKESFARILGTLKDITPFVSEIDVDSLPGGKEFIKFIESVSQKPVESWESSDGTLRALAILLVLETTPMGSTILIEEPEQALHPWAINYLLRHVQEVIEKRKIQVIMTTHSQQVLENISPEEVSSQREIKNQARNLLH